MALGAAGPQRLTLAGLGMLVFLSVYAPQSLLPVLARDFGVGAGQVGWAGVNAEAAV